MNLWATKSITALRAEADAQPRAALPIHFPQADAANELTRRSEDGKFRSRRVACSQSEPEIAIGVRLFGGGIVAQQERIGVRAQRVNRVHVRSLQRADEQTRRANDHQLAGG